MEYNKKIADYVEQYGKNMLKWEQSLAKPLLYNKIQKVLDKVYRKKLLKAEEKLFLKCQGEFIAIQLYDKQI